MKALISAESVSAVFAAGRGIFSSGRRLLAVSGVSIAVEEGRTLGVVGESGCGKSTLGRLMLGLVKPSAGRVVFDGVDLASLSPGKMRRLRRQMQMIFQDPFSSLNPRFTIGESIREPLDVHRPDLGKAGRRDRVMKLMERVGLKPGDFSRLPASFSGGQRQRVVIARALAAEPRFVVADEPVSALDVSIQAQILNLLGELREERGLTMLLISHDLRVVRNMADEVAVMYLGSIVELAPAEALFESPAHPYTMALVSAVPEIGKERSRIRLYGEIPSPLDFQQGCVFHPRCPIFRGLDGAGKERCKTVKPELKGTSGHLVACHEATNSRAGAGAAAGVQAKQVLT